MAIGFLTIAIIIAVIGAILYGRKLVKTEKTDAVFGNPERAKGGAHWVVVGASFLILSWMYYSWDIAKAFYPKSANELCQVGKVTDSLMSLKYLFPIDERQHKSTDIIDRENKNVKKYIVEIENHPILNNQDKVILIKFVERAGLTIPFLTNEKYLINETKNKIRDLTNRITWLTEDFQKVSYPPIKSIEEENKRLEDLKKQKGWGYTGEEVPTLAETASGLKFAAAAQTLNEISDEFFALRNHNPEYKRAVEGLRADIKAYRKGLTEEKEVETQLAKEIDKLARRIQFASIFPPKALDDIEQSIIDFDVVQNEAQGKLKFIDAVFFPGGTILSSGPTCSEDGPGRWLPKPSDTFRI